MSPIQLELLTNCNETFTTKEAYTAVTVTDKKHSIRARIYEGIVTSRQKCIFLYVFNLLF